MRSILLLLMAVAATHVGGAQSAPANSPTSAPDLDAFYRAAGRDDREARKALETIAARWEDGDASMCVDLARLMRPARRPDSSIDPSVVDEITGGDVIPPTDPFRGPPAATNPSAVIRARLIRFLEKQTGKSF